MWLYNAVVFMNEKQITQDIHGAWHEVGDGFRLEGFHCKGGKARNIRLHKACYPAGGPPAINDVFMGNNGKIMVELKLITTRLDHGLKLHHGRHGR